jgi:hypothetical protein
MGTHKKKRKKKRKKKKRTRRKNNDAGAWSLSMGPLSFVNARFKRHR